MPPTRSRLWPYGTQTALAAIPFLIIVLLALVALLKALFGWPAPASENSVLLVLLPLALLPLALCLLDAALERGFVLEYKGLKIDLSKLPQAEATSVSIAANIVAPGIPVTDSGSDNILEALRAAANHEVVVVDLEEGDAWWETRLLLLAAGAARRRRPTAIVFLGKDGGRPRQFQGWIDPQDLLRLLLAATPDFRLIYEQVQAAAARWDLLTAADAANPPPWMTGLEHSYQWLAFKDGQPNEFRFEQLLAQMLTVHESPTPARVTLRRMEDLLRPVLRKRAIDSSADDKAQVNGFFQGPSERYVAVVQDGTYQSLISWEAAVHAILRSMVRQNS